ncbi:MAG: hypothetical protein KBS85_06850 [Lachnospiraceae bacterium]|nr:hypothetical protein [Candidatus Merdinaster equi]
MSQNKQEEFLQRIIELKEISRLQGHVITSQQVEDFVHDNDLNDMQKDYFFQYLKDNKIGIDEVPEVDLDAEDVSYLDVYLEELKALPAYSDSELRVIKMDALAGGKEGTDKLIYAYLPYVADLAKLYTGQGVLIEDLIGEGNVALSTSALLLGAVEDIDEIEGFLGKSIMDAMEKLINDTAAEKKTEDKTLNKVNKVAEKAKEMAADLRRSVTVSELSEETGLSKKEIQDAIRMSGNRIEDLVSENE